MLTNFIRCADEIVQYDAYFTLLPIDEHTVHSLNIEKTELTSLWTSFKAEYDRLIKKKLISVSDSDKEEGTKSKASASAGLDVVSSKIKYRDIYRVYVRCQSSINELIDSKQKCQGGIGANTNSLEAADATPSNFDDILSRGSHPHIQLPPCDTDDFHGDYVTWPSFRDMFTALYINNPRLSNVVKLYHLRQKTTGEARDIVITAPLTNDGFKLAWDNLIDRYENKRILINSQLKTMFNLPHITKESGSDIKNLQRTLNGCINILKLLDINITDWDPIFIFLCSTHLPNSTLDLWEQTIKNKSDMPRWKDLDEFLSNRYQTLESVSDIKNETSTSACTVKKPEKNSSANKSTSKNQYKSLHVEVKKNMCPLCKQDHSIRVCPSFLQMSVENRYASVKSHRLCFNCLAASHDLRKCRSKFSCNTCKQRHHTLLHRTLKTNLNNKSDITPPPATSENAIIDINQYNSSQATAQSFASQLGSSLSDQVVLGTAQVHICVGDSTYTARALIDSGSEATFVSVRVQQALRLFTRRVSTQITGLNEVVAARSTKTCTLRIRSPIDPHFEIKTDAYVVRELTGTLNTCPMSSSLENQLSGLHLADDRSTQSLKVDLVLGGDLYPKIMLEGLRTDVRKNLVAQQTVFGWIITGKVRENFPASALRSFFNTVQLEKSITRFWEIEEPPRASKMSKADTYCEEYFQRTTYRNDSGRFVVSLPFKEDFGKSLFIGPSRHLALPQYIRNETRLLKTPSHKREYDSVISEYETMNHMIKTESDQSSSCYYLPHHAVIKPGSTTTKLRVVFNASSPSANGKSLNDLLYAGPILQNDLTTLVLRWRLYRYVFNADIQKMYRQILVNPQHTRYQRILHRISPSSDVNDFELLTVTFGVNSAPYLAIRVLLELAKENEEKFPIASYILKNCMYVDDVLAGAHNLGDAVKARNELIDVLKSAGFPLRKWTANNPHLLQDLPVEYLLDDQFLNLSDTSTTKTLGLRWNAGTDVFYFSTIPLHIQTTPTKRNILSIIAQLFDPEGWLAPKVIVAKIIMQQIWLEKTGWDEVVMPSCLQSWNRFISDYEHIQEVKITRWVQFDPTCAVQLHGFCDASEKAYAAALYLRITKPTGEIYSNLLLAKTRVAPLSKKSLPRLELCGAELLSRLVSSVRKRVDMSIHEMFLWTDSTIVLSWLKKPPFHWSTFVGNRVASIAEEVGIDNWHHVLSKDNPADVASRGTTAALLKTHNLWWHGPPWLQFPRSEWPLSETTISFDTDMEKKKLKSFITNVQPVNDILERFSSFPRAIRVLSYALRFFFTTHPLQKNKQRFNSYDLEASELKFVKFKLIKLCQEQHFSTEYRNLMDEKPLDRRSKLISLNPMIDSEGIIRVNGRLARSPILTFNERFPILLPYSAKFTRLLIEFIHRLSIHGECQLMTRLVRIDYWVPKLKKMVKTIISSCRTCSVYKQKQIHQMMAALPPERTRLDRPFTTTGVDFAGPFEIKSYTGRRYILTKGYVLVFVCFSTKAIHLEVTSDMSTSVFLAAFSRFFSRRGCPSLLYSDNGTSFVGASRILRQEAESVIKSVHHDLITQNVATGLEWKFIPPGAPHMGGLWEAGVKSFKLHLKKEASNCKFTLEEFNTLLTRIEACLNSRPISPQSENPNDITALTPGHFLIGGPILAPPETDVTNTSIGLLNRWQKLKRLHQNFAQRWKEEYLKELHRRYKWQYPQRDISLGDMVVVKQENLPPHQWRLGRIQKLYHGVDSKVRVVDIATTRGVITRPIVKLVVLPIYSN